MAGTGTGGAPTGGAVAQPQRYPLHTVLTLAIGARLAGYRGVTAFAEFAALLDQQQWRAVGCFFSPSQQCYTTPSITTFHNILARLPPETIERSITVWAQQQKGQVLTEEGDTKPLPAAGDEPPAAPARRHSDDYSLQARLLSTPLMLREYQREAQTS